MILYLTYDGLTDPLGQSQILPYLLGLAKKGHNIHIVSCEKPENFQLNKNTIQDKIDQEPGLHWHHVQYHKKPPLISTLGDLRRMRKLSEKLIKKHNIKMVHCRSYPGGMVGYQLKKKLGVKFLFDIRGFYFDERFEGGIWNEKSRLWKSLTPKLRKLETNMYALADHVVSLTHSGKKVINEKYGLAPEKIDVIPCCADLDFFHKNPDTASTHLNIAYLGSIGTWYLLDEMLDFFKTVNSEIPQSTFHFITRDDPQAILRKAEQKGIDKNTLQIYGLNRKDLPNTLSKMDLSVFFIKESFSKKASSPTKLGELLSMGIPVICNANVGDIAQQAKVYADCIVATKMNPEAYKQLIPKMRSLKNSRVDNHDRIRAVAAQLFSLKTGVNQYDMVYKKYYLSGEQ